jgi:hypothetical protein
MLKVINFKFRGSERSGIFGRPSDIGKSEDIATVLTKLDGLLSGTLKSNDMQVDAVSPIRSQADDLLNRGGPRPTISTQAAFATQVPNEIGWKSGESVERSKARSGVKVLELMAILSKRSIGTERSALEGGGYRKAATVPTVDAGKIFWNSSILNPIPDDRAREMSSKLDAKLDAKSNERQQPPLLSESTCRVPKRHPVYAKDPGKAPIMISNISTSDDSEKENSEESAKTTKQRGNNPGPSIAKPTVGNAHGDIPSALYDIFQNQNPLEGLKRVPRAYARIPEAQKLLLERKDSWFETQIDGPSFYANLPSKVQQDLTKFNNREDTRLFRPQDGEMDAESEHTEDQLGSHGTESENGSRGQNEYASADAEASSQLSSSSDGDDAQPRGSRFCPEEVVHSLTRDRSQNSTDHGQSRAEELLLNCLPALKDDFVEAVKLEEVSDEDFASSWVPTSDPDTRLHYISPTSATAGHLNLLDEYSDSSEDEQMDLDDLPVTRSPDDDTTASLALIQNQSTVASSLSKPPPNRYLQIPAFPSSSPADEDPLELAVPHAIGDDIEEDGVDAAEAPKTSQELPSTAIQNESVVQVEQTPFPNHYVPRGTTRRGGSHSKQLTEPFKGMKRAHDDISSDLVVPATFNDVNPQEHVSIFHKMDITNSDLEPGIGTLSTGQVSIPQTQTLRFSDEDKEDGLAQQQLFEELECSQRKKVRLDSSQSQSAFLLTRPSNLYLDTLDTLGREKATTPVQESRTLMLHLTSSPGSDERSLQQTPSPSEKSPVLFPKTMSSQNNTQKTPVKRRHPVSAACAIRRETGSVRDAREMARAKRHKFTDCFSATDKERREYAITRTQPWSSIPKQVTPNKNVKSIAEQPAVVEAPNTDAALVEQPSSGVSRSVIPSPLRYDPLESRTTIMLVAATEADTEMTSSQAASVQRDAGPGPGTVEDVCERETSSPSSFFDVFKHTYSRYVGSLRDFTIALVYIEWLKENKQLVHRSLYDDFIRVNSDEYNEYVRKVRDFGGVKAMTGWEFYNHRDQDPEFEERVITPNNLQEAISSLDPQMVEELRSRFRGNLQQGEGPSSLSCHTRRSEASVAPEQGQVDQESTKKASSPVGIGMNLESDSKQGHKDTKSRKPFFETPSQVPAADRNSWHGESVYGSKCKTTRRLPWPQNGSPQTRAARSPASEARFSTSTPSSKVDHNHPRSMEVYTSYPGDFRQEPGSPILGKTEELFSRLITKSVIRAESIAASLRDRSVVRSPTLQPDKPRSGRSARMSYSDIEDLEKVQGCLEAQELDSAVRKKFKSFKDFVEQRKRDSGFSSNASNASTPVKRFCTKPAKTSLVEPTEPETQAWSS